MRKRYILLILLCFLIPFSVLPFSVNADTYDDTPSSVTWGNVELSASTSSGTTVFKSLFTFTITDFMTVSGYRLPTKYILGFRNSSNSIETFSVVQSTIANTNTSTVIGSRTYNITGSYALSNINNAVYFIDGVRFSTSGNSLVVEYLARRHAYSSGSYSYQYTVVPFYTLTVSSSDVVWSSGLFGSYVVHPSNVQFAPVISNVPFSDVFTGDSDAYTSGYIAGHADGLSENPFFLQPILEGVRQVLWFQLLPNVYVYHLLILPLCIMALAFLLKHLGA